jgi:hypothetical protein
LGNGTGDDTPAFQKAIASGLTIYVPAGVYPVNTVLQLNNNQSLFGDGTASTILMSNPGGVGGSTPPPGMLTASGSFTIRDISLDAVANTGTQGGVMDGINVQSGSNSYAITRVNFTYTGNGNGYYNPFQRGVCTVGNTSNGAISGCTFNHGPVQPVYMYNAAGSNMQITNNVITFYSYAAGSSITVVPPFNATNGVSSLTISGNSVTYPAYAAAAGTAAFYLAGVTNCTISTNTVDCTKAGHNTVMGIYLLGTSYFGSVSNVLISGNQFLECVADPSSSGSVTLWAGPGPSGPTLAHIKLQNNSYTQFLLYPAPFNFTGIGVFAAGNAGGVVYDLDIEGDTFNGAGYMPAINLSSTNAVKINQVSIGSCAGEAIHSSGTCTGSLAVTNSSVAQAGTLDPAVANQQKILQTAVIHAQVDQTSSNRLSSFTVTGVTYSGSANQLTYFIDCEDSQSGTSVTVNSDSDPSALLPNHLVP